VLLLIDSLHVFSEEMCLKLTCNLRALMSCLSLCGAASRCCCLSAPPFNQMCCSTLDAVGRDLLLTTNRRLIKSYTSSNQHLFLMHASWDTDTGFIRCDSSRAALIQSVSNESLSGPIPVDIWILILCSHTDFIMSHAPAKQQ